VRDLNPRSCVATTPDPKSGGLNHAHPTFRWAAAVGSLQEDLPFGPRQRLRKANPKPAAAGPNMKRIMTDNRVNIAGRKISTGNERFARLRRTGTNKQAVESCHD
jgi:hypothetical protein